MASPYYTYAMDECLLNISLCAEKIIMFSLKNLMVEVRVLMPYCTFYIFILGIVNPPMYKNLYISQYA